MRKSNGEFEAEIFRRFDEYKEKKKKRHRAVRAASLCMAVVLLGAAVLLAVRGARHKAPNVTDVRPGSSGAASENTQPEVPGGVPTDTVTPETASESERGTEASAPVSPDPMVYRVKETDEIFSAAYTEFALGLLCAGLEDGKNTLVSPLSVMEALAMASNGASGRTLDELMSVIGGGIGTDDLTAYLRGFSLDSDLVRMANSVWIRDGFAVRKSFLEKNGGLYGAGVFTAPFDDSTVDAVNAWINAGTNGMIGKMLERGALNDSDICLCNAVFFDGRWVQTYKDENIVDGLFRRADGTTDRVTMLRSEETSALSVRGGVGVRKMYDGLRYEFISLMPDEGTSLGDFAASFDGASLRATVRSFVRADVELEMPEFRAEYSADLTETLKKIGIKEAFEAGRADFSGIADGNIRICSVRHKTAFTLDRNGTLASSATVIGVPGSSEVPSPKMKVTLDRPFIYMIVDSLTALPVFIGALETVG